MAAGAGKERGAGKVRWLVAWVARRAWSESPQPGLRRALILPQRSMDAPRKPDYPWPAPVLAGLLIHGKN